LFLSAFNRLEKIFIHYNLFIGLVIANMVLITVDILGWAFNGLPGQTNFILNKFFNLLLYILIPAAPSVWVLYADYHVYRDETRLRKYLYILVPLWAANAAVSCVSLWTGWFFGVTSDNIYYRGEYFWFHVGLSFALLVYSFFLVLFNRKKIERKYYFALQTYLIPQVTGSVLQMVFYGVSYNWVGMMLSLLLIYNNIQNSALNTDRLTGIYNRSHLEAYIRARVRRNAKNGGFSAIFLDLDGFKEINDSYGHHIGDEAIRDAADILRKSIRQDDFIARIGGDEFVAVLNGPDRDSLLKTVARIEEYAADFNHTGGRPYKLNYSIGYDIYDAGTYSGPDDFLKNLDLMMYRDKQKKRCPASGIPKEL
jgi:diguanylate cyclase (GGDEF)-like protein